MVELQRELAELSTLVASIAPVNVALQQHEDPAVRDYLTVRRRFDNAAFVVALYASFEKFVENLIGSYAQLVARSKPYSELPEPLAKKHLHQSADLLARARLGEGRHRNLRAIDVVRNLFDCLSGAKVYALTEAAIIAHEVNLRYEEVTKLLNSVGLSAELLRGVDVLGEWYRNDKQLDGPLEGGVPVATLQRLDDLVERRNAVTHRGGNPSELLGSDQMHGLILFVSALCRAIFDLAVAHYLSFRAGDDQNELNVIEGPYQDSKVVVVALPQGVKLFVGQPAVVRTGPLGARWGRIQGLQVDSVSTQLVESSSGAATVGVELDFRCKKGVPLLVLVDDDELIWEPLSESAESTLTT